MKKITMLIVCIFVGVGVVPVFSSHVEMSPRPNSAVGNAVGLLLGTAVTGLGARYAIQGYGLNRWTKAGVVTGASVVGGMIGVVCARLFGGSGKSDIEKYEGAVRFVDRVRSARFMTVPRPELLEAIGPDHGSVKRAYDYFCQLEKELLRQWGDVDSLGRRLRKKDDEWSCDLRALCERVVSELDWFREEIRVRRGLVTDRFEFSSAGEVFADLEVRARAILAEEMVACAADSYQKTVAHGLTVGDRLSFVLASLRRLAREILEISQRCVEQRALCEKRLSTDSRYLQLIEQYDQLVAEVRWPLDILEQRVVELFASDAYKEEQTALEKERYHSGVIGEIQGVRSEVAGMIARFGGDFEALVKLLNAVHEEASTGVKQNKRIESTIASVVNMISMIENKLGELEHRLGNMNG